MDPIISQYVDDPDIVPILEKYIDHLGEQVEDMRAALSDGRCADLQRFAHRMKGSGGNYGYPMLTEAAKDLEEAMKTNNVALAGQSLNQVALLCDAIEKGYYQNTLRVNLS